MNKIPTVFVRDPDNRRYVLLDQPTPECSWVFAGDGTPRRKYDGTCVLFSMLEGRWYARREVKPGKEPPPDWFLISRDDATGKSVGWESMRRSSFVKFHEEAVANTFPEGQVPHNGTYELIGPKINGNPEKLRTHMLARHATAEVPSRLLREGFADGSALTPAALVWYLGKHDGWEGIVWHHPDGRMAKLKYRDLPPAG